MKIHITLLSMLGLLSTLNAETVAIVKKGKATNDARVNGSSWKSAKGLLSGSKPGQTLATKLPINGSEFSITATLTLDEKAHTAAGVYIGSDMFGFDGKNGSFFLEGGNLNGSNSFNQSAEFEAGKEFEFEVKCKNNKISFYIDDKLVITRPYKQEKVSRIALRPHRNTMHVRDFTVDGDFLELEKLNHLFACGEEGYKSYRIPALVTSKKGTLLAFCEGRKHHHHDHGDIDIVLKRSTDNGKTWSKLDIVFDNDNVVAGNPVPIVDQKTGRIYLISCTSDHHEYAIYKGEGRRGIFIQHSDNDGKSWSRPRDISENIYPDNWRWYATGPCSGIQIQQGKYAGRLVVPANHSLTEDGKNALRAHSIYSDDNGKTWHLGESSELGGNESSIAEVSENLLYQSIRMQTHRKGARGTRYSRDGGETWSELKHDQNLPCPMCQGSVIRDYDQSKRLIHTNPGAGKGRTGMTVRISDNGGKSWPYSKLILESSSAYSDSSITQDDKIALLYEGGHYDYAKEGIIFTVVDPDTIKKK